AACGFADRAGRRSASAKPQAADHLEVANMALWLLKTEPDSYSWDDLARDKKTTWDGVSNALALKHIRTMKKGDLALIYHTGNEKQIIGVAQVTSNAYKNPQEADERIAVVDLKPPAKLRNAVPLDTIK